jgi:endonuclease VIII
MPEGPSIVILREAVEALHLKRKEVTDAGGTAKIDMEKIIGRKVTDFRSMGKQFLICFKDCTIRIHFMLFGSYLLNDRKKAPVRLRLQIGNNELNFYACSVKVLDEPVAGLYDWESDIMSDEWKSAKALKKLKNTPEMLACDALLDQNIFAGSGNIIKNEVLFRIRLHPLSVLGEIPDTKLKEMVKETRKYSFDFLDWKKENALKKHWLAHTKKTCPRCHIPFHKEYLGKNRRRSYFCTNCQVLYTGAS